MKSLWQLLPVLWTEKKIKCLGIAENCIRITSVCKILRLAILIKLKTFKVVTDRQKNEQTDITTADTGYCTSTAQCGKKKLEESTNLGNFWSLWSLLQVSLSAQMELLSFCFLSSWSFCSTDSSSDVLSVFSSIPCDTSAVQVQTSEVVLFVISLMTTGQENSLSAFGEERAEIYKQFKCNKASTSKVANSFFVEHLSDAACKCLCKGVSYHKVRQCY